LKEVYVYPDGEQYDIRPDWKSDDYEIRMTDLCEKCDTEYEIHYGQPFASCECHTTEWRW
jgi:hypothetical protein